MSARDWYPDPDPLDVQSDSSWVRMNQIAKGVAYRSEAKYGRPGHLKDWVGPSEFAFRRREWRRLVLLALGVGAALGFVAGWVAR